MFVHRGNSPVAGAGRRQRLGAAACVPGQPAGCQDLARAWLRSSEERSNRMIAAAQRTPPDRIRQGPSPYEMEGINGPSFGPPGRARWAAPEVIQSLKFQGLGLRWFGLDAESGPSEESAGEAGPVLDALEPVLHDDGPLALGCRSRDCPGCFHVRPGSLMRCARCGTGLRQ